MHQQPSATVSINSLLYAQGLLRTGLRCKKQVHGYGNLLRVTMAILCAILGCHCSVSRCAGGPGRCPAVPVAQEGSTHLQGQPGRQIFLLGGEFGPRLPSLEHSEKSVLLHTPEKHGKNFLNAGFVYFNQL